jgi:iron-sulfur cluster repair protein YtfE (RIC family)
MFTPQHHEVVMQEQTEIDTSVSVNEMVARHPETMPVFNRFGLDTCCGGGAPIDEAARRDGADLGELVEALQLALRAVSAA